MSKLPRLARATVKKLRPNARHDVEKLVKVLASRHWSRTWFNTIYRSFSFARMDAFHTHFAKLFRDGQARVDAGEWIVDFVGKPIHVPLRPEQFWLDWDTAVSVLGHDVDVKRTYANLLKSSMAPDLFLDIGTNYGTHSILFLVHGVKVFSFDPNPLCHDYFRELCRSNNVEPHIEDVALADQTGFTDLWFPETETWLGTTNRTVIQELESKSGLTKRSVKQRTLDDFLPMFDNHRLLIKIDTEGSEHLILQGAAQTLEQYQPLVIFESIDATNRTELFALFEKLGYGIANLPWSPDYSKPLLKLSEFIENPVSNFIALPIDKERKE